MFSLHDVLSLLLQRSNCSVEDNTTIACSTPNLNTTSLTPLNYALMFDDSPLTTQARLPISVQSDPSKFRLEGSQEVPSGIATLIRIVVRPIAIASTPTLYCLSVVCIQGDNLNSVEASEIRVTVGGEECVKTLGNSRGSEVICTVPFKPPGGENPAIIRVSD